MGYNMLDEFSMPYFMHTSSLIDRVKGFPASAQGFETLEQINVCMRIVLPLLENGATYTWQIHNEAIEQMAKAEKMLRAIEQQNKVTA